CTLRRAFSGPGSPPIPRPTTSAATGVRADIAPPPTRLRSRSLDNSTRRSPDTGSARPPPPSSSAARADRGVGSEFVVFEEAAADDHALDVGGALADEQHRGLAVQPLDLVLLGEALPALDGEGPLHPLGR